MNGLSAPAGSESVTVGRAEAVAVAALVPMLRQLLSGGTLYAYAAGRIDAKALSGRQTAYAIPAPGVGGGIVVRHNRHGGLLAGITGDRFRYPTRAPYEFDVGRRLAAAGVPTPEMVAYVVYRAGAGLARADVATRLVEPGRDLAGALAAGDAARRTADLDLVASLVAALSRAGARHHDLNSKNVLIADRAMVLDVDRVQFGWKPQDALAHNLARLDRSLRKRRERLGERISDEEIAQMARSAAERM